MTFCEMHKSSGGCIECPNRYVCNKADKEIDTGFVQVSCPACGRSNDVEVIFPAFNRGFDATNHNCKYCGQHFNVTDPHVYNEDGTIRQTERAYE